MALKDKLQLLDVIIFLKHYGLWYNFTDYKFGIFLTYLQIFRFLYIIIVWPFSVLTIYHLGVKNCLDGTIYFSVIALMGLLQAMFFHKKKADLELIIENIKKHLINYNEHWEINIFQINASKAWKLTIGYRNMLGAFIIVYMWVPIIVDVCRYFYFEQNVKLFRVPLPLVGFLGLNPVRNFSYYTLSLLSVFWAMDCIGNHLGIMGSLSIFTYYTSAEIQVLRYRIRNLKFYNYPSMFGMNSEDFILKNVIHHHQSVISLAESVNKLFGFPLAVQNIAESFNLCLTLFSAVYEYDKDVILFTANVVSTIMNLSLLYGTCFIGEFLQTQSKLLYEELCDIPWYEQSPAIRRDILLMLMQSSKLMKIDYKGKATLNLRTFMQVVNSAYSYFMVLKSSMY